MNKKPLTAFFLSIIPGVGHYYLNRKVRGILYGGTALLSILIGIVLAASGAYYYPHEPILASLLGTFIVGVINIIDMVIHLLGKEYKISSVPTEQNQSLPIDKGERDRISTVLLSFIPGLGHFQLGLMNRGLTFLIGFFGLGTMIVFVTAFTGQEEFMVFLGILPILWIYNMFDMNQQLHRKKNGEELVDRTILEDFEETRREQGRKSKTLATILSIFPGAGHMYMGLQRRGLQLMAGFLFGIYILDILRLSIFLFLIPIIWFYSFFDALQKIAKQGEEELEDVPVISYFVNHQKWIGIGLLALGIYYMFDNIMIPILAPSFQMTFGIDLQNWYYNYFQMTIVCILLIGGGLKLLVGSKSKSNKESV